VRSLFLSLFSKERLCDCFFVAILKRANEQKCVNAQIFKKSDQHFQKVLLPIPGLGKSTFAHSIAHFQKVRLPKCGIHGLATIKSKYLPALLFYNIINLPISHFCCFTMQRHYVNNNPLRKLIKAKLVQMFISCVFLQKFLQ